MAKFRWPFQAKRTVTTKIDRTPTLKQLTNKLKAAAVQQFIDEAQENPELLHEIGAQYLKLKPKDLGDEALRKALADGDVDITKKVLDAKIKRMGLGARDDPMEQLIKWKTFLQEFEGPKRGGGLMDFLTPELLVEGLKALTNLQQQQQRPGIGAPSSPIREEIAAPSSNSNGYHTASTQTQEEGDYMFGPELDTFLEDVLDRLAVGTPSAELAEFVIYELNRIGVELQRTDPTLEKFGQVRAVVFMPPALLLSTLKTLLESRPEYARVLERLNMSGGEQDIKDFCIERDALWDKLKKEQDAKTAKA